MLKHQREREREREYFSSLQNTERRQALGLDLSPRLPKGGQRHSASCARLIRSEVAYGNL